MLTQKERNLRTYLKILLGIYIVIFASSVANLFTSSASNNLLYLVNLTGLEFLSVLLCWYSISDIRRFNLLVKILIWKNIIAALIGAAVLLWANTDSILLSSFITIQFKTAVIISIIFNSVIAVLTALLLSSAEKDRYGLKYFSPLQFKTLDSLAEVIIYGEEETISSEEVAKNVDTYFNIFEARTKWTMALVVTGLYFYPLLSLMPPLPYISPERRLEFLKSRFYRDVESRMIPEFWRVIVQGMIRIAKQMCYIGYYNDKRTFPSIGYVPFSERKDKTERLTKSPVVKSPELFVKSEKDIKEESVDADAVIVGSGAAASILAKRLIEKGRKVLMVERGNHEIPETFTENEMEMVSRLFQDGAIQAARDFRFTVFQGSCVGGSTVLNNAVCFKMPEPVLDRWIKDYGAGLDKKKVMASMDKVFSMIGANNQGAVRLNPGGYLFEKGCRKLGYNTLPNVTDAVNANISGCLGCGYCNIGCRYNKKLSMLTTILPEIQKIYGKESLEIIAGCEAVKLNKNGNGISYLEGEFRDGRKIKIYGKTFIVSAGAISSSILLLKSKLGIERAGMNLSFNMGSQLTAAFPDKIDSYDGLQISHFMKITPDTGFIMESWFNPPMFQSTAMPGWFEDHYRNMKRYDRLTCVGLLVGSESNAKVRIAGLTGREIEYTPTEKDFRTLLSGLELAGEIMLEAGAESVMPNTFKYYEFKNKDEVRKLHEYIKDPSEITLGTGHPQGGNIIGSSPDKGVVNPEFKVFGFNNLYVCDASVFPTSLGVNPQLTVMALADYASEFVN
ncbi:MAG TPA: GMC family oxidoreductase [Ignavibacteriaceae bacterium]|nr:GMC family oxidoreductase [Ignavibacteriaceae bacterium]